MQGARTHQGSRPGVLLDRDGTIIADSGYVGSVDRRRVPRRRDRGDRRAQRGRHPGGGGDEPGRRRARLLRASRTSTSVHKHMVDGDGASRARTSTSGCSAPTTRTAPSSRSPERARTASPVPGMALAAAEALDLDLTSSWVVGDSACDIGLARAVGARPLHVGPATAPATDVRQFPDLAGAVDTSSPSRRSEPCRRSPAVVPGPSVRRTADAFGSAYAGELAARCRSVDMRAGRRGRPQVLNEAYDRGRRGLRLRQRRFGIHRQPPPVRPRQGRAQRHRSAHPGVQPQHQHRDLQRHRQRPRVRDGVRVPAAVARRDPATCWSRSPRPAGHRTSSGRWNGRRPHGMRTIALTGFAGGPARELADVSVHVDSRQLRDHRGRAPGLHAPPRPVRAAVADERRRRRRRQVF